jgi:hypothetical protein
MGIEDTQAGQAVHANYAMSYELVKNVRLGFNGYWLQQLTDHRINGVSVANSKERTVGLGPGLQLTGRGLWFRVNSYIETGVRNRPSGIKLTMRISRLQVAPTVRHSTAQYRVAILLAPDQNRFKTA